MNKITKVTTKQKVKSDYVNTETGEELSSEIPDLAYIVRNTDQVIIDYKEFIVMNSEVFQFLSDNLSSTELGKVMKLSNTIKSNWNILHNKKTNLPFELSEIAEEVSYTRDKFHLFMKKLYKASIVYKLQGYWDGVPKTVYILNPHLAKCTKTVNEGLLTFFEDITNEKVQAKLTKLISKK